MANPFDILPLNLFNLFITQGYVTLQRHYMAILLRLYALAEFNRFGLTRENVIAEIMDYLRDAHAEEEIKVEMANQTQGEDDSVSTANPKPEQDYASFLIRRLEETGWIEREQHPDYTESITLPDYAFTLLEAFRKIQEQKPHDFPGQLYAAHQLITAADTNKDFSPALAVTQAYENVRQMVRGLSELNQNIRRYVERATREKNIADILRLQFEDYSQTLGASYHALKTSDHVSRYRRDITRRLQTWELDSDWLTQAAEELSVQSRMNPAQAEQTLVGYVHFIIHQLEGLDPLIEDIDKRHAQYLRTSLRQIRYQLGNADGSFKDKLVALARQLSALKEEGMEVLPDDAPALRQHPVDLPDIHSYYTPPQRRAPFVPDTVIVPILHPDDLVSLRALTMQDVTQAFSPEKVNRKVLGFFNGHKKMCITELPREISTDLHWLTTIVAYAHHPEVSYGLEITDGEPVDMGTYRIVPFELYKL
ncbi:MAG: hypothetical protein HND47_16200 [Chloroflexi bacterium]|nr:hypothetical protein [Chloroflexota bacterium]